MFSEAPILIAEDNLYWSLDLSSAVEDLNGRVVGPASSVAEALTLLAIHDVAGAIVDFQLGDQTRRSSPGNCPNGACRLSSIPQWRSPRQFTNIIPRFRF
jgi:ActR/RegA family two-component response regulator